MTSSQGGRDWLKQDDSTDKWCECDSNREGEHPENFADVVCE